ncbi:MAG: dihydrolipoamide succinyltransferase, partial [Planctomycetota bacterium]
MSTAIVIPELGESVTEGVISAWLKAEGEWAERDEPVLELETDKITTEIPAPASGVVHHGAGEGETVQVGAAVGSIDEAAEKPASAKKESKAKNAAGAAAAPAPPAKAASASATAAPG